MMSLCFLWLACTSSPGVPDRTLPLASLSLNREEGLFYDEKHPYSGHATQKNSRDVTVEHASFLEGKRHGFRKKYYGDGAVSEEAHYVRGKKDGRSRTWWPNGQLRSESNFKQGVPDGMQRQWYQSGARFKEINLDMGKEKGLQRAWRENGAIYNNYEAKDGRIFGLRRSKLCFELKEEDVVRAD